MVTVTRATADEVPAVHAIACALAFGRDGAAPESGFLVSGYGLGFFHVQAHEGNLSIAKVNGAIAGYFVTWDWRRVALPHKIDYLHDLVEPQLDVTAIERAMLVETVGVSTVHRKLGVGAALYADLYRRFPDYDTLAIVVEKPERNEASIRFHEKEGFTRVAGLRLSQLGPLAGVESGIWYRRPA